MEIIALLKDLALMPVDWVRAHVFKIATTFTTALLVVYGDQIKAAVKRCIRPYPFVIRTLIFDPALFVWLRYADLLNNPVNNTISALLRRPICSDCRARLISQQLAYWPSAKSICNVNTITKEHSFCLPYILAPLARLWMMAITTRLQICATSTVRSI